MGFWIWTSSPPSSLWLIVYIASRKPSEH
jgi:hypothetical protein